MNQLRKWLFQSCVALSLLIFVASAAAWAASYRIGVSYFRQDGIMLPFPRMNSVWFECRGGGLAVAASSRFWYAGTRNTNFSKASWQTLSSLTYPHAREMYVEGSSDAGFLGFEVGYLNRRNAQKRAITLPLWFIAAATSVLPVVWFRRMRELRGIRLRGLCRKCGYDLRATPTRCPECGKAKLRERDLPAISEAVNVAKDGPGLLTTSRRSRKTNLAATRSATIAILGILGVAMLVYFLAGGSNLPPRAPQPFWVDIMPFSPATSVATGGPALIFNLHGTQGGPAAMPVDLEIRSAGNSRQIAVIHDFLHGSGVSGGLWLDDHKGELPDGDYLLAMTVGNHTRCSNVAALKIDSKFDATKEPILRLIPVPTAPGDAVPSLWLVVTGPKTTSPQLNYSQIPWPTLTIDGLQHNATTWRVGPSMIGPGGPGKQDIFRIDLENYYPEIPVKLQYKVKALESGYVSPEIILPAADTLGPAWDKATPTPATPTIPPASNN